jgi:2-phosphosulfolactate phosphatase
MARFTSQSGFELRFEWGEAGLRALAEDCATFVVVDVLSFTTCVSLACARGAAVLPFPWQDERVRAFAEEQHALLAGPRRDSNELSLSPASLSRLPPRSRIVLPSPNGSELAFGAAKSGAVYAGSLRNASALAARLSERDRPLAVIAAGERWPDARLRPAAEDLIGAGAILARLGGTRSPEAELACAAWRAAEPQLARVLRECASGVELAERGFAGDVELAAQLDADAVAPRLRDGAFEHEG